MQFKLLTINNLCTGYFTLGKFAVYTLYKTCNFLWVQKMR